MIKRSLLSSAPIVKHFRSKINEVPFWAKIWRFWGINSGLKLNLSFITPKRHILAWFHVFWAIALKNPSTGLTCSLIATRYPCSATSLSTINSPVRTMVWCWVPCRQTSDAVPGENLVTNGGVKSAQTPPCDILFFSVCLESPENQVTQTPFRIKRKI